MLDNMTPEEQSRFAYLESQRAKYLEDYEIIGQHEAKHFTGEFDDGGNKVYKKKAVYTGMFPQLVLRKKWKSTSKYNVDGSLKEAV